MISLRTRSFPMPNLFVAAFAGLTLFTMSGCSGSPEEASKDDDLAGISTTEQAATAGCLVTTGISQPGPGRKPRAVGKLKCGLPAQATMRVQIWSAESKSGAKWQLDGDPKTESDEVTSTDPLTVTNYFECTPGRSYVATIHVETQTGNYPVATADFETTVAYCR